MTGDRRYLLPHLPKAGFRWREGVLITSWYDGNNRRDRYVCKFLFRPSPRPQYQPEGLSNTYVVRFGLFACGLDNCLLHGSVSSQSNPS